MALGESKIEPGPGVKLTEKQVKARKARNVAIAVCLFGMVVAFYAASVAKLGPAVLNKLSNNSTVVK